MKKQSVRVRHSLNLSLILLFAVCTALATLTGFRWDAAERDDEQREVAGNASTALKRAVRGTSARLEDLAAAVGVDDRPRSPDFRRLARPLLDASSIDAVFYAVRVPDTDRAAYEGLRGRPILEDPGRGRPGRWASGPCTSRSTASWRGGGRGSCPAPTSGAARALPRRLAPGACR